MREKGKLYGVRFKPFRSISGGGDPAKTHFTLIDLEDDNENYFEFIKYILADTGKYKTMDSVKTFKNKTLYRDEYSIKCQTLVNLINQLEERGMTVKEPRFKSREQ